MRAPDDYQHIQTIPDMFRAAIARGEQQLGQGATTASKFYGQVAADNGFNQYQDAANKILHGDPQATTIGPDGQPQQDLGYLGLKGRAALDARPDVAKKLDELQKQIMSGMNTPEMQLQFDNYSRRYRTSLDAQIGSHADTQANTWYGEVNTASAALAKEHIANNAGDDAMFLHGLQDLKMSYAKQADLAGGGPELKQAALDKATREAYTTRVETLAATDPAAALKMADANKAQLGPVYGELRDKLQTRADKQIGDGVGEYEAKRVGMIPSGQGSITHAYNPATGRFDLPDSARSPAKAGDKVAPPVYDSKGNPVPQAAPVANTGDAASVIRHFENPQGPWTNAHWDVNHWRVGYSSDTVTRADGTVEPVTATTTVTPADAERDLARRVQQSQSQIKASIGNEAWEKLSPHAQAAITSVAYNYGHLPNELVAPAQSGDAAALAQAVARLPSNPDRRRQEAAAITGGFTVAGPAQVAGGQAMQMPRVGAGEDLEPEAQAPVLRSLADQRASAMGAIMDNPDLNFTQRQHALAYVEQQYSGRTTENSVEKQTLESTVPNLILAKENGVENVNIPWDRVQAAMPPAKFQKWKDEADIADQTGTAIKALRWSSPEDVASMQRDIESGQGVLSEAMKAHSRAPTTGPGVAGANPDATEDEAMRFRLRQGMARQFEAALSRRQALLVGPEADPAQYVADHPVVAAARSKLDPSQPATYQAYAAAILGVQQHVGAGAPQILDKGMAERLAARWNDPDAAGGGTAVAKDMAAEAAKWGTYWPQIYKQIAPKGDYITRVVAAGARGTAGAELLSTRNLTEDEVIRGDPDSNAKKDIATAVSQELKPLAGTLTGSLLGQTLSDYQKAAEKLAAVRLAKAGDDPSAAAKSAVADLVNWKYDFLDNVRIPKNPDLNTRVIQAGLVEALQQVGNATALASAPIGSEQIGPLAVMPKRDVYNQGVPEEHLAQQTINWLRRNGTWVTNTDETGVVLMKPGGDPAIGADGNPMQLTWRQVQTLGSTYAARERAGDGAPKLAPQLDFRNKIPRSKFDGPPEPLQ